jgi:hypothetical protein
MLSLELFRAFEREASKIESYYDVPWSTFTVPQFAEHETREEASRVNSLDRINHRE